MKGKWEHFKIYPTAEITLKKEWSDYDDGEVRGFKKYWKTLKLFIFGCRFDTYHIPDLHTSDIFYMVLIYNLNHVLFISFINLCLQWGGMVVFLLYVVLSLCIAPALSYVYAFLGSYSGRTFANIWDMVPLFNGFQWTSLLYIGIRLSKDIVFGSLYLRLMFHSIFNIPWGMCNSPGICKWDPTEEQCKGAYNFEIGKNMDVGLFKYIRDIILNGEHGSDLIWSWIFYVILLYIIFTTFVLMKFKRYKMLILRIFPGLVIGVLLSCYIINMAYYGNPISNMVVTKLENVSSITLWLQVFNIVLQEELPTHWITVGCFCKSSAILENLIWIIYSMKILTTFFILVWIPYLTSCIQTIYEVDDIQCIYFTGLRVFIIVIPQLVSYCTIHTIFVIIYFFALVLWSLISIVVEVDLTYLAVLHKYSKIYRYRNILIIFICTILAFNTVNLARTNIDDLGYLMDNITLYIMRQVTMICMMILFAIYTLRRIDGDYFIVYGVQCEHMTLLKTMMLAVTFSFILFIADILHNFKRLKDHAIFTIAGILLISPICISVIYNIAMRLHVKTFLQPDRTWGPRDLEKRKIRKSMDLNNMFVYHTIQVFEESVVLRSYQQILLENNMLQGNRRLD